MKLKKIRQIFNNVKKWEEKIVDNEYVYEISINCKENVIIRAIIEKKTLHNNNSDEYVIIMYGVHIKDNGESICSKTRFIKNYDEIVSTYCLAKKDAINTMKIRKNKDLQ